MSLNLTLAHDLAAALIKRLEACRLTAYQDSVGRWTCGWGSTGSDIRAGTVWTQEIADHRLDMDMAQAEERLTTVIFGHYDSLAIHQFAALWSFVFNLGAQPGWTIWKDINSGNLADVPIQMARFDKGMIGGRLVAIKGLDNRRAAEIAYWNTADLETAAAAIPVDAAPTPPSGYTRPLPTPPTPAPAPPMATQSLVTKGVTLISGIAAAAGTIGSQVHDVVAPHASEAPIFQTMAVAASGLVVCAAIVGILIHADQAHQRTQ